MSLVVLCQAGLEFVPKLDKNQPETSFQKSAWLPLIKAVMSGIDPQTLENNFPYQLFALSPLSALLHSSRLAFLYAVMCHLSYSSPDLNSTVHAIHEKLDCISQVAGLSCFDQVYLL